MLENYVFYDVTSLNEFVAYLRSQIWSILLRGIPLTIILLVIPVCIKLIKYFIFQAQTSSFEIHLRNSVFKTWLRKKRPELLDSYLKSNNKQRFHVDFFRNGIRKNRSNLGGLHGNSSFHNKSKRFRPKFPYKSFTLSNDKKYHSKVISKEYPYKYNPNRGSDFGAKRYRSSVPYGRYKNRAYTSRSNAGYQNYSHSTNKTASNFTEPIANKTHKPYATDLKSHGVPIANSITHGSKHDVNIEYTDDVVIANTSGTKDVPINSQNFFDDGIEALRRDDSINSHHGRRRKRRL